MKPCCLFIFLCFLFFSAKIILPQDSISYKKNSIVNAYENILLETDKKKTDAMFISFKSGYHYAEPVYDKGLKGNWVVDVSIGAIMNNKWIIGINFEYWKTTINDYSLVESNSTYDRDYKAYGVSLFLKYKIPVYKDVFDMDLGLGIGTYGISYKSILGNFEQTGYLNLNTRLGFNIKIIDFSFSGRNLSVNINSEIAYYSLITMAENKNLYKIYNFKIGPSINLYY